MDKEVISCIEEYKRAEEVFRHNKETALDDVRFSLLGDQWDENDKAARKKDGRPCMTYNRLAAFVRQIVNDSRQNKPAIVVRPVDSDSDPETAEIYAGLIRNIEVSSNADIAYDTAILQAVAGGFGYFRVNIQYAHDDTFDKDIVIERIHNQLSVTPDPDSVSADGSDWMKCWIVDRLPTDDFKAKYPKAKKTNWHTDYYNKDFDAINDDGVWIAEYWEREEFDRSICLLSDGTVIDEEIYNKPEVYEAYQIQGIEKVDQRTTKSYKVTQKIMTGAEVLEENEWAGKYIPIVPVLGDEVIVEGKKYYSSAISNSKDAQRNYNFWRTTSTESVSDQSKSPYIAEEGTLVDPHKWATANRVKYAVLEHKKGTQRPTREPFAGIPAGAMQEALNSNDDIKATMGMFDASLGAQGNEQSGRAIIARQTEGDTSTFHFIDNLSRAIRHLGRIVVDLIPKVYTGERIIRVLGVDNKEPTNVQLGKLEQVPQSEFDGEGFNTSRIYDLSLGKYDVTVDAGPSFATKRQEAAYQMTEMVRAYPQLMQIAGDLLAENLDWPGADELAKRMKAMLPPQLQQNQEAMALQQQLQMVQQQAQAAISQLQAQFEQLKQDKMLEMKKIEIDAYNAETNRLKATQAGMQPEQVQALVMQTLQQVMQTPDISLQQPGVN